MASGSDRPRRYTADEARNFFQNMSDESDGDTVDLSCNEVNGSELKFRYNQGFVTDKVLYNMYN